VGVIYRWVAVDSGLFWLQVGWILPILWSQPKNDSTPAGESGLVFEHR
jgi:hypothetical protein